MDQIVSARSRTATNLADNTPSETARVAAREAALAQSLATALVRQDAISGAIVSARCMTTVDGTTQPPAGALECSLYVLADVKPTIVMTEQAFEQRLREAGRECGLCVESVLFPAHVDTLWAATLRLEKVEPQHQEAGAEPAK